MRYEFYDKYDEARRRPMKELKREWGTIKHALDYDPLLTDSERAGFEARLEYIEELIDIRRAYERDAEYKRTHNYKRWRA